MKLEPMTEAEASKVYKEWLNTPGSANEFDLIRMAVAVRDAQWQAAIAEQPATQYCWLVENGKQAGQGLAYRTMEQGWPEWTEDPQKAIRFSRRDDAEMFAQEDEDAWRIVEHGFESPDAALPPKAEPAPHARDAITWTPETGYVFATEASKPVQDHIDTPINMVATKQAEAPTASIERERADFEIELRKQCFQMPTPEAFDLAWSMWKARAAQQEAPTASNEREAFEAHARRDRHDVTRMLANPEIYDCNYTQVMWEGWQLKDRAALATQQEAQPQVERPCGGRAYCGRFPFCGCGGPDPLPERDPTKPAEQQGVFRKFDVRRVDGSDRPGGKHEGCEYFVLDTNHDKHAAAALAAYADAVEATHPQLAADMRERYELAAQAEPAGGDKEDAERWRAFISLDYAVRSEWATNLSLLPVLTGWLDSRASYIRSGDCPARGDDGLSASDADLLEQVIGELEDDGETMVDYDDLMWFALRGYLHCKYFEVKPEAQEAIDAARAAQQATERQT